MARGLEGDIEAFRSRFRGAVLTSSDPDYDSVRSVWNGAIDRRPAVIARCATAEDVAVAIRFGQECALEISIRGGGHDYAAHAVCEVGAMIDLSPMNHVHVDPTVTGAICGS